MRKIGIILLCGLMAGLLSCQKDKEVSGLTMLVKKIDITPSVTSATIVCDLICSQKAVPSLYVSPFPDLTKGMPLMFDSVRGTNYMVTVKNLWPQSTYYIGYQLNGGYTSKTLDRVDSFTTLDPSVPQIRLLSAYSDISNITCYGRIDTDGGLTISEYGVCYSTSPSPTIEDKRVSYRGSGSGEVTCEISGLDEATTYYVRAYAVNSMGVGYSNVMTASSGEYSLPDVSTLEVKSITCNNARCLCEAWSVGYAITECGIYYGTSAFPSDEGKKVTYEGVGNGEYSCSMDSLTAGTTYYVQAYAVNQKGVGYGSVVKFTTNNAESPSDVTAEVTNVTYSTATCIGRVGSNGGTPLLEYGFCYDTSSDPDIYANKIKVDDEKADSFACVISGLTPDKRYFVRAYAINMKGITYSDQLIITPGVVDLGLSVKWAICNVGATSPENFGNYYAWGDTTTKDVYWYDTYKYFTVTAKDTTVNKYCSSSKFGSVDSRTTLQMSDDAARHNWGGEWRMPTSAEWTELRTNCTWTWYNLNGVNGYMVSSNVEGNNNWIFLPAAAQRMNTYYIYEGGGVYWSSSLETAYSLFAKILYFNSTTFYSSADIRCMGCSVRAVCSK